MHSSRIRTAAAVATIRCTVWGVSVQERRASPFGGSLFESLSPRVPQSGRDLCLGKRSLPRVFVQRALCPGGSLSKESLSGVSLLKEVSVQGGLCDRDLHPSPCGQTDICENITFPQLRLRVLINYCRFNKYPVLSERNGNFLLYNEASTMLKLSTFPLGGGLKVNKSEVQKMFQFRCKVGIEVIRGNQM